MRSRFAVISTAVKSIPEKERGEGKGKGETTMINADRKLSKRDYY